MVFSRSSLNLNFYHSSTTGALTSVRNTPCGDPSITRLVYKNFNQALNGATYFLLWRTHWRLGMEGRKMRGEVYVKIEKHAKVCVAKEYYVGNLRIGISTISRSILNLKIDPTKTNNQTMRQRSTILSSKCNGLYSLTSTHQTC